jgi:hypothetical protein
MVLANLFEASRDGKTVFYSRDRNHYTAVRPYAPRFYRYASILSALESLEAARLIRHRPAAPGADASWRSTLRPNERLISEFRSVEPEAIQVAAPPPILLRDRDKRPVPFPLSPTLRRLSQDVSEHNAFLAGHQICLRHPEVTIDAWHRIRCRDRLLDGRRRAYGRVFNESFVEGGRWYGPWWQNLPKVIRSGLTIDREPVIELDYKCCHLRLLGALNGKRIDVSNSDPFALPDWPRAEAKLAFNVLQNCKGPPPGQRRTQFRAPSHPRHRHRQHAGLIAALETRFPDLSPSWSTGVGRRLQAIDAHRTECRSRVLGGPATVNPRPQSISTSSRRLMKRQEPRSKDSAASEFARTSEPPTTLLINRQVRQLGTRLAHRRWHSQ